MKLHIGGESFNDEWKILNVQSNVHVDFLGSIENLNDFKTEQFEEIYASHVFEHVKQRDVPSTLNGIFRILKTGGRFYISVPDMDVLCEHYLDKNLTQEQRWHVMRMIFGGQTDAFDFHFVGWNQESLATILKNVGFSSVDRVQLFGLFRDASSFAPYGRLISLNMIAVK